MTAVNGKPRRRRPDPVTVRELMRPSMPFKDRTVEEITRTAEAWAIAGANASRRAPKGIIGGKGGRDADG